MTMEELDKVHGRAWEDVDVSSMDAHREVDVLTTCAALAHALSRAAGGCRIADRGIAPASRPRTSKFESTSLHSTSSGHSFPPFPLLLVSSLSALAFSRGSMTSS